MTSISTLGAIAALVVAIVLILRKVSPAYGMMAGAPDTISDTVCRRSAPPIKPPTSCLLYTSPSPRDQSGTRMPPSA
ncbi:hypothetical protein GEP03_23120 [Salmonella enterica subsp. enterica serovar Anatum]|nr:hypothetical protein [Salmonella enterica subsp. enterica serovar Anatum]